MDVNAIAILIVGLICAAVRKTDCVIRCTAPSVLEGEKATITCFFNKNVDDLETDVLVKHFSTSGELVEVLDYDWSHKTVIKLAPGYADGKLSNATLTFTILAAKQEHEGRYMCEALPTKPGDTELCNFTLREPPTHTTSGYTWPGGADSLTETQTASTESDEEDADNQAVLIGVPVGVGVFLIVAILVWCLWRKRLRARCVKAASYSNRGSGNVSTLDIATSSRRIGLTEEDREHNQPLNPENDLVSQETETNSTTLTSPSQRSEVGFAERARSTDSAASPPTNGFTALKDSSQGFSEQNCKHRPNDQALKALQDTGAVIIAGPEKCGKTTLGRKLLNHLKHEGFTETMLHDPSIWSSYVRDPDKKYAFLFDECFKAGDRAIPQNTWTHCFRNLRDRHCPLVIIVQTSERKEEDVQAFSFLRNIPVVFAVGEETNDSASKTITEKEDKPGREVGNTAVDPSGKVGGTSAGVKIFKGLIHPTDLVIFNVAENPGEAPDKNAVNRILKQIGISDSGLREVTCITRLGEKKDWPPRPIKITVNRLETKQKIVAYAKICANKTKRVHIRPYTTETEIENLRATYKNEWWYE